MLMALFVITSCKKEMVVKTPISFDPQFTIKSFPSEGSSNNSYTIKPYFTFNKKIGFRIEIPDNTNCLYVIDIDSLSMTDSQNNKIKFTTHYSSAHDTLFYIPDSSLTSNTTYKTSFSYSAMISEDKGITFIPMMNSGVRYAGTITNTFKVKSYVFPESIDTSYITYSYPVPYQYYFLRYETDRGVLKLKDTSEVLKYYINEKFKTRFSDMSGKIWENDAVYDPNRKHYTFTIPCLNFEKEKIYKFEFIRAKNGASLLTWHFRTSMFDKFEAKLLSMNNIENKLYLLDEFWLTSNICFGFKLTEPFDCAEGKLYSGLVRMEAQTDQTSIWMTSFYSWYSSNIQYIDKKERNSSLKIPPTNAIRLLKVKLTPLLNSIQISDNLAPSGTNLSQIVVNCLSSAILRDYCSCKNQVGLSRPTDLERGTYKFKFYYYAGDKMTFESNEFSIKY